MSLQAAPSEIAQELRAAAPLFVEGPRGRRLVGGCILFDAGDRVIGFTSRALLRSEPGCRVATRLDGEGSLALDELTIARSPEIAEFTLQGFRCESDDVVPLDRGRVGALAHAMRGLPFVVGFAEDGLGGYRRVVTRVTVEAIESITFGGDVEDAGFFRADALDPVEGGVRYEGAPLFVRHPASRALDRPAETLVYGLSCAPHAEALEGSGGRERALAELAPIPHVHRG